VAIGIGDQAVTAESDCIGTASETFVDLDFGSDGCGWPIRLQAQYLIGQDNINGNLGRKSVDILGDMRSFVRVVEAGSFRAAADQSDCSTAHMSRAVSTLEKHLGIRLLHRTTRHIGLTDSGERYFARLKTILSELDFAVDEARSALTRPYGRLRLHSVPGLGQKHVTGAIVQYQLQNPEVKIELSLSQRIPNLVEDGFDISLLAMPALPDSGYVATTLGASYSILVASPDYIKRRGAPATLFELSGHTCLRLELPNASADEWHMQGQTGTYLFNVPDSPFQVNMSEALRQAIRAGVGIGPLAVYSAIDDIRDGRLVRVLPTYRLQKLNVYAVYHSRQYIDAKVTTFLEHLRLTLSPALEDEEKEIERLTYNSQASNWHDELSCGELSSSAA
jgi:DNA-binding transcriptional LysR family regulator